jgi:hypothetical protein
MSAFPLQPIPASPKMCAVCRCVIPDKHLFCQACLLKKNLVELMEQQREYMPAVENNQMELRLAQLAGGLRHVLLMRSTSRTFCGKVAEHYKRSSALLGKLPVGTCKECLSAMASVMEAAAPAEGEP